MVIALRNVRKAPVEALLSSVFILSLKDIQRVIQNKNPIGVGGYSISKKQRARQKQLQQVFDDAIDFLLVNWPDWLKQFPGTFHTTDLNEFSRLIKAKLEEIGITLDDEF